MSRSFPLLSVLTPLCCGALAFVALGVPDAHAAQTTVPSFSTEVLQLAGETVNRVMCGGDSLTLGRLFDFGPHTPGGGSRSGGLQGVGIVVLALAAVIVIALGRMRLSTENKRLDVAQRLIEQGMEPPSGLLMGPARNDLRKGIVLLFAGGGVLAAGLLLGDRGMAAGALVPEFIGAGYLVSFWLAARAQRGDP